MFFYILYKFGYILANILSLRAAYWLAERFSDIQYFVAKDDRDAVLQNLSVILKKDAGECRILARKVFRNFGLYLVDFFRMRRFDKKFIKRRVHIVGLENVDGILRQNRGVIVVSSHLGNWEMGGVVMAILGYKISAVALNHMHKNINDFFIQQREGQGLKVIKMASVMKDCVLTLLRKEILALVGDRNFTNTGIISDFFGMPISFPRGPAMLSLKANSAIIPGFFIREGRFNYKFIFEPPIESERKKGIENEEIAKETTARLISVMEKYIKAYPEQWLIFRKFWETPVEPFAL